MSNKICKRKGCNRLAHPTFATGYCCGRCQRNRPKHGPKCTGITNADRKCKTASCTRLANQKLKTGYCCHNCQKKKKKHGLKCTGMSWKDFSGRKGGSSSYKFGDITRGAVTRQPAVVATVATVAVVATVAATRGIQSAEKVPAEVKMLNSDVASAPSHSEAKASLQQEKENLRLQKAELEKERTSLAEEKNKFRAEMEEQERLRLQAAEENNERLRVEAEEAKAKAQREKEKKKEEDLRVQAVLEAEIYNQRYVQAQERACNLYYLFGDVMRPFALCRETKSWYDCYRCTRDEVRRDPSKIVMPNFVGQNINRFFQCQTYYTRVGFYDRSKIEELKIEFQKALSELKSLPVPQSS